MGSMTPADEIKAALERLTGPAEYAATYVMHEEPDDVGSAEGVWEKMIPLDKPLADLIRDVSTPLLIDREPTQRCCRRVGWDHEPDCALLALVRAINGEKP
jgi:hypothetical protein